MVMLSYSQQMIIIHLPTPQAKGVAWLEPAHATTLKCVGPALFPHQRKISTEDICIFGQYRLSDMLS